MTRKPQIPYRAARFNPFTAALCQHRKIASVVNPFLPLTKGRHLQEQARAGTIDKLRGGVLTSRPAREIESLNSRGGCSIGLDIAALVQQITDNVVDRAILKKGFLG